MKVLITGTSSGIGRAIAEKFIIEGHEVIGFDILPARIVANNYTHMIVDVTKILPEIDGVEILVNNAGVQDEETNISVNLEGAIKVTEKYGFQSAIKSILHMASSSAHTGAEFPLYAASKGGILAYTKNVAQRIIEISPKATVNSISPGGVLTDMNKHILENENLMEQVLAETLLGRWMEPEEVGEWAYFMTTINKSATGIDILIDNGEFAKCNFIW